MAPMAAAIRVGTRMFFISNSERFKGLGVFAKIAI
jgi:hypothetical protein